MNIVSKMMFHSKDTNWLESLHYSWQPSFKKSSCPDSRTIIDWLKVNSALSKWLRQNQRSYASLNLCYQEKYQPSGTCRHLQFKKSYSLPSLNMWNSSPTMSPKTTVQLPPNNLNNHNKGFKSLCYSPATYLIWSNLTIKSRPSLRKILSL